MIKKDFQIAGTHDRPITIDLTFLPQQNQRLLVFMHGFKGFKDWGHWNQLANHFARAGFAFLKFNFTHNGTRPDTPLDFADLDAFGQNTYSTELADAQKILQWIQSPPMLDFWQSQQIHAQQPALIGHSRGGGIASLTAAQNPHISALILWASVADLGWSWQEKSPQDIQQWLSDGLIYTVNLRTRQKLPLNYNLYQDYIDHQTQFNLPQALQKANIPTCIIHGTDDPAVHHNHAQTLHNATPHSQIHLVPNANHTFNAHHPYLPAQLPPQSQTLYQISRNFLNQINT